LTCLVKRDIILKTRFGTGKTMELARMDLSLTGTPDTLRKIQAFLALMHFNQGHSGTFGIHFDGDGHERLTVDPAPHDSLKPLVDVMGGIGIGPEIAGEGSYSCETRYDSGKRVRYIADKQGLRKITSRDGQEDETTFVVRFDEEGKKVKTHG
jgi:hypothetical protein